MILSDMKTYKLQKLIENKNLSGQKKGEWIDVEDIKVAVYLIDEMSVVGNIRYDQYDCAGLTFYTNFNKKDKYRIAGDENYIVERAVRNGCTVHLLLKRIEV